MKIYFDLDGTLARFEEQPNAMDRFINEKGFFLSLEPTKLCKELVEDNKTLWENIHILSTSPNKQATKDKIKWVEKHLPKIKKENIIVVYENSHKQKYAKGSLLIDDHTPNLREWQKKGGYVIKAINKHNNKKGISKALGYAKIIVD